ncbi:MAG: hypothetical protein ACLQU9_14695 [Acidimicrobiales bacterium]|jgi:hypothetical protein
MGTTAAPADEERNAMDEDGTGPAPDEGSAADVGVGSLVHEELPGASFEQRPRSHRAGMLGGLAVVGVLLAVLVAVAPGGSRPTLPAQSVHDVGPIPATGPRTAAATTPPVAASAQTTTSTGAPGGSTTTTPTRVSQRSVATAPSSAAVVTAAPPPTTRTSETAPSTTTMPTTTTRPAPPPPTSTTTTTTKPAPPPTTTTTTSCTLVILCD